MSHLESPLIEVKPITASEFRVTVDGSFVVLKFDLSEVGLADLLGEGLEALLAHESEMEACSFCGPDGGLIEGDTCELVLLMQQLRGALRQRKHQVG